MPNTTNVERLHGGNRADDIVRIGDRVHRTNHPWSPAVRVLLNHLEATAPGTAPASFGLDDEGRDVISFVEGEAGHYPLTDSMRSDESLARMARLIRRFHDATAALAGRTDLPWAKVDPDPERREVICHNDLAPYNSIYQDGLPGVIFDFEHAGPGSRARDITLAVYRFVPLATDARCQSFGWNTPPDRIGRLSRFLDAYGSLRLAGFLPLVEQRIADLRDNLLDLAESEPDKATPHLESGHIGAYNRDLAWIEAHRDELEQALNLSAERFQ